MPTDAVDPFNQLEAAVASLCDQDWASWSQLPVQERLEQRQLRIAPLTAAIERFIAAPEADPTWVEWLEAQVEPWSSQLQEATRPADSSPPLTRSRHWYTLLRETVVRLRYALARRQWPDECKCKLAELARLPIRPPPPRQLIERARGFDDDMPWDPPWVEYRCRQCGTRWRQNDASSQSYTSTAWSRV